jgi:euchromatic histone-lysine N-methyltransferase
VREITGVVVPKGSTPYANACLVHPAKLEPRWKEWGDVSDIYPNYESPNVHPLPTLGFSLDLSESRNVGCYLSHNAWPNLFVQHVLYYHYNESYPHLMVFSMENIPPLTTLSIDYGDRDEE